MAFPSGAKIRAFGDSEVLDLANVSVVDNGVSGEFDLEPFINTTNARSASILLTVNYNLFSPAENSHILIFAVITGQEPPTSKFLPHPVESIPVKDVLGLQRLPGFIDLSGFGAGQSYNFYIWNQTLVDIPTGWGLTIRPTGVGSA